MEDVVRIDKWLCAVRIFKTRSIAAEACDKGRVLVGEQPAKPSRNIRFGEIITIRKPPVVYTYRVTGLISKRVSASVAENNYEDMTSVDELEKLKIKESFFYKRDRGTGRPTKKERRMLDQLRDDKNDQ